MNSQINKKITPVMQQYLSLKSQYQEYMLFYRLGDFYELFFDDAVTASKILNIVLTKRGHHNDIDIPMCGVPFHSSESYIKKLIDIGYKVAICEQLETPEEAKKRGNKSVVRRDVVRIVTPGTTIEDSFLNAKENNYLTCITKVKDNYAIAWLEMSTGVFFYHTTTLENINSDLLRISPKELLIADKLAESEKVNSILEKHNISLTQHAVSFFDSNRAHKIICDFYNIKTLEGLGRNLNNAEISACGALIEYIKVTQKGNLPKLGYPKTYVQQNFMFIDGSALKSLELFYTQFGEKKESLLNTIDYTKTASGGRLLKQYISAPLACSHIINKKLDAVEFFVNNQELCKNIREILHTVPDIERILTRLTLGKGSPKDMYNLKLGLEKTLELSQLLYGINSHGINVLYDNLGEHSNLTGILDNSLLENNISNQKEGSYINPEYDPKLSELFYIQNNSHHLIGELRNQYRKLTGITTLKILYNNIIGYYIEVSANHIINLDKFIHRQSLSNSVRYTTTELKELESKIITSRDAAINIEIKIFGELCTHISENSEEISLAAHTIAELDMITSLSELAIRNNYVRPIVDNSTEFKIIKGRHPVIEAKNKFIANDIDLSEMNRISLITGPNMAGKSTFLRQNALIAILAHIGSFVPAEYAHIGVIDKIFSRVGASDNISSGHSTFMVEMVETAAIINQATYRSLVILDEVGRGTGVYDGISIAWAVVEHIHNVNRCRSIFATHYHELSKLSNHLKHLRCFCMKVEEWNGKVIFLHQVISGSTNKSYGIHIAKIAGFPPSVLKRAESLMEKFKEDNSLPLFVK